MRCLPLLLTLLAVPVALGASVRGADVRGADSDPGWTRVVDLRGTWRFHIGDGPDRAAAAYDHGGWEEIFVPGAWESEGYWGYDGTAWYRRGVRLTERDLREPLYLRLGRVDDVDQVWVNGRFVGSTGRFPESNYETAYFAERAYRIPPGFLRPGENVIAIRVYDAGLEGGLLDGPVGLFTRDDEPPLALDLSGTWRFRPGQGLSHLGAPTDAWAHVTVPGKWEPQGFPTLDDFAWYRHRFTLPDRLRRDDLVLVAGRIDDLHEVYLNGERIGGTPDIESRYVSGNEWRELRAYPLPSDVTRSKNDLAVRVYDGDYEGGIYDGPVGIMTRSDFERWSRGGTLLGRLRSLLGLDD
jgi:sialate O-acetylesterase